MRPDDGRVIPTFLSQALRGEDLTIYGDGSQTRCFCYADDMIRGLRSLMNTDGLQGEVINIGMENEMTIRTLADIVVDICDTDSELVYESLPEDDPRKRRPDISKARTLLNWEPEVSLAKGLKHTLEYFQTHEYLVPHDASSPANDV
jgi:UDP-glucuronate decarboxylase